MTEVVIIVCPFFDAYQYMIGSFYTSLCIQQLNCIAFRRQTRQAHFNGSRGMEIQQIAKPNELKELERILKGTWQLVQVVGTVAREVVYA
jgi:hypothetical protein